MIRCPTIWSPLFRDTDFDGQLREIPPVDGSLRCLTLGVDLSVADQDLQIFDSETGVEQLTEAEFEQSARLKAEQGQERECEARKREQAVRVAAEDRVRELEEELRRLKNKQS